MKCLCIYWINKSLILLKALLMNYPMKLNFASSERIFHKCEADGMRERRR